MQVTSNIILIGAFQVIQHFVSESRSISTLGLQNKRQYDTNIIIIYA